MADSWVWGFKLRQEAKASFFSMPWPEHSRRHTQIHQLEWHPCLSFSPFSLHQSLSHPPGFPHFYFTQKKEKAPSDVKSWGFTDRNPSERLFSWLPVLFLFDHRHNGESSIGLESTAAWNNYESGAVTSHFPFVLKLSLPSNVLTSIFFQVWTFSLCSFSSLFPNYLRKSTHEEFSNFHPRSSWTDSGVCPHREDCSTAVFVYFCCAGSSLRGEGFSGCGTQA